MRIFLLSYNFRKTCYIHQHFNLRPTVTKEHLPHFMVPFSNFFRIRLDCWSQTFLKIHTATSRKTVRKVVGKSARANLERYCGWFWVHCSSKKFERMAREAMDICLRVLKESNKSRFDSYSVRNSVLIMSHITYRDCRVHTFFRQPFSK